MIETKRLILRPFEEKDLNDLFHYLSQIKVHCFMDIKTNDLEDAKKQLKERISNKEYFAIMLKDNSKVIGEAYAHEGSKVNGPEYENAYSLCLILNENYQHKGYMHEAAKGFFDYLFKERNARRIYAYVEDNNFASQKLCLSLHMRKEAEFKEFVHFVDDSNGNPIYENTLVFSLLRKEWNL